MLVVQVAMPFVSGKKQPPVTKTWEVEDVDYTTAKCRAFRPRQKRFRSWPRFHACDMTEFGGFSCNFARHCTSASN
ncbi:unnamed protein product [Cladocopium goreaui]|uniref:Uncharacterized protein n=1 Tax=Cladocopium goreaui TaxID=2562237 RepID=A0A9P1GSC2_9DINO|nr:unnamed protein product [Cladocopium goreaui]